MNIGDGSKVNFNTSVILEAIQGKTGEIRIDCPITPLPEVAPVLNRSALRRLQEQTTPENISLYRSVFRGRVDVVPKYWKSTRDGKSNYSPICDNEWVDGVCNKKNSGCGGCGKCKNTAHTPLTDALIDTHIAGGHILGVYPLLQGNTCHFIAADFDRHKPEDPDPFVEVKRYLDACYIKDIPAYVLKSKSGNGYHVYIFFSEAVPAWKARAMAFFLLGEAGVIGNDVELSTFDRLFPNQARHSGKGLGNLISLPFQGAAGHRGNTLLLDPGTDYIKPYQDQWEALRILSMTPLAVLDAFINEWDLEEEDPPKREKSDSQGPIREERFTSDFSMVKDGCKFIEHCCEDAGSLKEPEWYAFLSIVGRCKNGRELAHKHSEAHPSYNYAETESKLEHALNDTGPHRCETIKSKINDKFCKNCSSLGRITSPITLGEDIPIDEGQIVDDAMAWIEATDDNRAIIKGWLDKVKGLESIDIDIVKNAVQKKTGAKISNLNRNLKNRQKRDKVAELKKKREKVSTERAWSGIREITYEPTATGVCCHEVSEALKNHPEGLIYRFAGDLVKIINRQPATVRMIKKIHDKGGNYPSMPVLSHLGTETLCHEVEKVAICQIANAESDTKEDIPWPKNIMNGVMALTESHEKPLVGIVEHPYVDDDFNPVLTQGYDDRTGLYKAFDINPRLDHFKDAISALLFLNDEVFQDFPFASDLDTIAAISCLLTGMQRKLISDNSGCPGYLFTAPTQSSGKTTLCQLINYILYARPAAAASYSDKDEEMGKLLLGILREGHSCILFDNLPEGSVVESNELAKVITSDAYSNRWLGENRTVTVPCGCLWMMTGNNVSVCGDFNTRFLNVEIDTKEVNPDQRHFKRTDIGAWCEANREKILGACLQIIMNGKDYHNKGLNPSRFPSWDKFVRLPLYKITEIDVADIFQKNKLSDPKIEGQRNFFGAWFDAFSSSPITAKQVLDHCQRKGYTQDNEMAEALVDIFSGGSLPSTRALGKWLAGMKNRFFGDYKLVNGGKGTNREQLKQIVWIVQDINSENN